MKPKVFVTRPIPEPGIRLLEEFCETDVRSSEEPPTKEELIEGVKKSDGLLCLLTDKIDREVMESSTNLKVISSMSVGVDHVDVKHATSKGIYVCYTPGVLTDATADFTWALLMTVARRVVEANSYVREGKWRIAWSPTMLLGAPVYGKTLGIVGLGRIGRGVANRAKGFNMRVIYYDVVRRYDAEKDGIEFKELNQLLKESDFVSIHVPLTPDTKKMIGEEELKMMKPTAYLVNTSRGQVVDEEALIKALKEGWIAGAALDVFEKEPIDLGNPLLKMNNVVLSPHIASATTEARAMMAELAAKNMIDVFRGKMPSALYNPEVINVRSLSEVAMINC